MNFTPTTCSVADEAVERAAREGYGRLLAYLAARTHDLAGAQDALADAFAAALTQWRVEGVPDNPAGWLFTIARRRQVDAGRRRATMQAFARETAPIEAEAIFAEIEGLDQIPDRRLALLFACAHPALDAAIRAPLMLQAVLGFDAAAVGSAFLVAPATMAQRLTRAKQKIRAAGIPFSLPDLNDMPARLDAVLEGIYAAFTRGWEGAFSHDPRQRNLAEEAIWLGRLVAQLVPNEAEALGLLALMTLSNARKAARRDAKGRYVPLDQQDTNLWDHAAIGDASAVLGAARALGRPGRFQIEAAIQAEHVDRAQTGRTDWAVVAALYAKLADYAATPVVEVNRAVALANAGNARVGLAILQRAGADGFLDDYQSYWAALAELSTRCGLDEAATHAYGRAIGLETDPATRAFLMDRRAAL